MKYAPYSYSRLSTYIECPRRFQKSYIEGVSGSSGPPAMVGSVLHDFIARYDKICWTAGGPQFDQWERVAKLAIKKSKTPIPADLRDEIMGLAHTYASSEGLELEGLIGIEEKRAFNIKEEEVKWNAKDAFIRGAIDRLQIAGPNAKVTDHKSGQRMSAPPLQLKIYAWIVSVIWAQVQDIECEFNYLRHGWQDSFLITADELPAIKEEVNDLIERIEADEKFTPVIGDACSYCDYFGDCPAMKGKKKSYYRVPVNQEELDYLVRELIAAGKQSKEIKKALRAYIDINGPFQAVGKDWYYNTKLAWKNIDTMSFLSWLQENKYDWGKYCSLDWTKIRNLAAADKAVKALLDEAGERTMTVSFGSKITKKEAK